MMFPIFFKPNGTPSLTVQYSITYFFSWFQMSCYFKTKSWYFMFVPYSLQCFTMLYCQIFRVSNFGNSLQRATLDSVSAARSRCIIRPWRRSATPPPPHPNTPESHKINNSQQNGDARHLNNTRSLLERAKPHTGPKPLLPWGAMRRGNKS